jgi:hypothetical protein
MVVQEIATRTAKVWLDADGILRTNFQGIEESLDDAQRTVAAVVTLAAGTPRPVLADVRAMKALSRDVRIFYMESEGMHLTSAAALLIGSPLSRLIGNVLAAIFGKANMPIRLFTSEANALVWLQEFVI